MSVSSGYGRLIGVSEGSQVEQVFVALDSAVRHGRLITRAGARDKEFHFQDWVSRQLDEAEILHDGQGRNSYPDFVLVASTDGFEVKGLAYPGREADYDCNSQVPTGKHNGRDIFYVFGRYPANVEEDEYPVIDLVVCHGSLLNADSGYVHSNKSIRAFGSYGDILLRDRKMYVAPTPFALLDGTAQQRTLIVPSDWTISGLDKCGEFVRVEVEKRMSGYTFDLVNNTLTPTYVDNPSGGVQHAFTAWRAESGGPEVDLKVK